MADPIIPDHYRAQVRFQGPSGLPEDVWVNSWAFRNDGVPGDIGSVSTAIPAVLEAFYTFLLPYLAPTLFNSFDPEVRMYDLGQTPPREPIYGTWTVATQAGTPFPAEVACCLSYYADRNIKRSRGRLYLGPLKQTAGEFVENDIRPTAAFVNAIIDGAENVLATSQNVTWVLISQADADAKPITAGWVDNAFDTQRRRGLAASTRTSWPVEV